MPLGLQTDLYELTMAAGYVAAGKQHEVATFELFLRRLPPNRNFILAAGLQQAVEYLLELRFTGEEIAYLRKLPQFVSAPAAFWDALAAFRFTGDLFAVREGTPVFAGEPLLTVRAPLLEAQIPETFLLATIGYQSMIASKAARIVEAAGGRAVVEFGSRRAHSAEAAVFAARASYIGGCIGTSNAEAGYRFGIPVFGTSAHSWVTSFDSEKEAFQRLQALLGPATTYLVDTYDTIRGTQTAAALGRPIWGVRLDSGNLAELSRAARRILDEARLADAKVMVSGDLNEYKILELVAAGLPIDAMGVGTDLVTSADAPSLGAVYKMVELQSGDKKRYTAKFSEEKQNLPGAKQIFRYSDRDVVGCSWECFGECDNTGVTQALLEPIILNGSLAQPLDTAAQARDRAHAALARLPAPCRSLYDQEHPYRIEYSKELQELYRQAQRQHAGGGT